MAVARIARDFIEKLVTMKKPHAHYKITNFDPVNFGVYLRKIKYAFTKLSLIIKMECYQNGKRFTFRQNDDILRASSIIWR